MVANIRCAEIAHDQLEAFLKDQAWQTLEQEATAAPAGGAQGPELVPGFSARLAALLDSCVQGCARRHPAATRAPQRRSPCHHRDCLALQALTLPCVRPGAVCRYEEDAMYFDAAVRAEKLQELQAKLGEAVAPALQAQTQALQRKQLEELRRDLLVALVPKGNGAGEVQVREHGEMRGG